MILAHIGTKECVMEGCTHNTCCYRVSQYADTQCFLPSYWWW